MVLLLALATVRDARAQSNDGFHAIQVFPVAVDTAAFRQRFHFRKAAGAPTVVLSITYYPAEGTEGAGTPVQCPGLGLFHSGEVDVSNLRALCAGTGIQGSSAFGTVVVRSANGVPFSAYSRVSNAAGAGFSVEAFPASDFTAAGASVTGLRRTAARFDAPAYQSNCFVGNLGELGPASGLAMDVAVSLHDRFDAVVGATAVSVLPGQLVRLLDVFAAAGAAQGDHEDVVAKISAVGPSQAGMISFCTVQDNTSFGADFRIGKQEVAWDGAVVGAQDEGAARSTRTTAEVAVAGEASVPVLTIPPGDSRNVHQFYFRHPDVVSCRLLDAGGEDASPAMGLEMRLVTREGGSWAVVAGGNDAVGFSNLYLGDKWRRGGGANTTYQIEVESNGQNAGLSRAYGIACSSGSGHSKGELVRKGAAPTF